MTVRRQSPRASRSQNHRKNCARCPISKRHRRHVQPRETAIWLVHHVDATSSFTTSRWFFRFHHPPSKAHASASSHSTRSSAFEGPLRSSSSRRNSSSRSARATGIDQLDVLHLRRVRGALKHHVFEQMRKPAAPRGSSGNPNFVIHAHVTTAPWYCRATPVQTVCQLRTFPSESGVFHAFHPMALSLVFFQGNSSSSSATSRQHLFASTAPPQVLSI